MIDFPGSTASFTPSTAANLSEKLINTPITNQFGNPMAIHLM